MMSFVKPQIGSVWLHTSTKVYKVLHYTNENTVNPKYPTTIVYMGVKNEEIWSRPLADWHRSMTLIQEATSEDQL